MSILSAVISDPPDFRWGQISNRLEHDFVDRRADLVGAGIGSNIDGELDPFSSQFIPGVHLPREGIETIRVIMKDGVIYKNTLPK